MNSHGCYTPKSVSYRKCHRFCWKLEEIMSTASLLLHRLILQSSLLLPLQVSFAAFSPFLFDSYPSSALLWWLWHCFRSSSCSVFHFSSRQIPSLDDHHWTNPWHKMIPLPSPAHHWLLLRLTLCWDSSCLPVFNQYISHLIFNLAIVSVTVLVTFLSGFGGAFHFILTSIYMYFTTPKILCYNPILSSMYLG